VLHALLWPLRRVIDPRFDDIQYGLNQVIVANAESTALLGRSLAAVEAAAEETNQLVRKLVGDEGDGLSGAHRAVARLRHGAKILDADAIDEWPAEGAFDAVLSLERPPDAAAMRRIGELTRPGAVLVLRAPYDRGRLDALLDGWNIEELTVLRRDGAGTWVVADDGAASGVDAMALVTAVRG
jgi:hypothetical protein